LQEGCEWRAPPATATLERVRAHRWDIYCDEIVLGKTPVELEHLALLPHHEPPRSTLESRNQTCGERS
jgi:hypothetical protein